MEKSSNLNDLVYWKDMISGDEIAFSFLFKKYYSSLYNFGKLYTSDSSLISDSIQDLFMDLWEKRKNLGSVHKVKSYLYDLCLKVKSYNKSVIKTVQCYLCK